MSAPLAAALLPLALLAPTATPASASPASSSAPTSAVSVLEAAFDPATAFVPPTAVSYAADLVPYGSHARVVTDRSVPGRTVLTLTASGLAADHEFPVHLHTGSCGADPASSGPHYQNAVDPVQPSTDPAYANEHNELRLLLRTDGRGGGTATTAVDWQPRPGGARSLVLHAGSPAGPRAAGDRVACVKLER